MLAIKEGFLWHFDKDNDSSYNQHLNILNTLQFFEPVDSKLPCKQLYQLKRLTSKLEQNSSFCLPVLLTNSETNSR